MIGNSLRIVVGVVIISNRCFVVARFILYYYLWNFCLPTDRECLLDKAYKFLLNMFHVFLALDDPSNVKDEILS